MAITESELKISNKSYTNKDFAAIYEELLDYAKKISNRYDPTTANESDAILILFKLLAFVGDKISYNVDKNILEQFISSCTQESSMYDLTNKLGYNMHYYKAATTNINLSYDFDTSSSTTIFIPQYTTITNDDNTIEYVTLQACTLNTTNKQVTVSVMQGKLNTLTILDNTNITLTNLDTYNRLYFPEKYVAQNGVFINGGIIEDNEWECVDNLNVELYNSPVFVFKYDSKQGLPYIEFPEWINNIIGNGLSIKYITTIGEEGNVAARTLTSISNITSTDETIQASSIKVVNTNASTNGQNPETIDEAYQSFKKTIGTFDTLVTCRDYANYIYNNMSSDISNVIVTDRRTDINYASNVITYDLNGVLYKNINENDAITAYDLCIYPLTMPSSTNFTYSNNYSNFKESFKYYNNVDGLKSELETLKTMSHDIKNIGDTDITCIKNYYKLDAIISTNLKVNTVEQASILKNVNNALASTYYARNVDFGEAIAYDNLLSTIINADTRIKNVSLYEPNIETKVVTKDVEHNIINSDNSISDTFKTILCKNLLSGRISLFDYKDDFEVLYTHNNQVCVNTEQAIELLANISVTSNNNYQLKSNEVVQLIAPSLITKYTATYGVNYYLKLADSSVKFISANNEYKLQTGDVLKLQYVDSSDDEQLLEITSKDNYYIKPTFNLYTSSYRQTKTSTHTAETPTKIIDNEAYYTLSAKQEINVDVINKEILDDSFYCYWYTKHKNNNKFELDLTNGSYILDEGEYFFYSDKLFNNLYIYGSGTKLILSTNAEQVWQCSTIDDINSLLTEGVANFTSLFVYKDIFKTNNLTIEEQQIISLSSNDIIYNYSTTDFSIYNNIFANIDDISNIKYKLNDSDTINTLTTGLQWQARGLIYINTGPNIEYYIEPKQILRVNNTNYSDKYIQSSVLIQGFSSNLDATSTSLYIYNKTNNEALNHTGHYNIANINTDTPLTLTINNTIYSGLDSYVAIYVDPNNRTTTIETDGIIINKNNVKTYSTTNNNIFIIKNATSISISHNSTTEATVKISDVRYINGINSYITDHNIDIDNIQNYIKTNYPNAWDIWDQINYLDTNHTIDLSTTYKFDNPQILYNKNNLANPWVIDEIDFDYINTYNSIKIATSSTK